MINRSATAASIVPLTALTLAGCVSQSSAYRVPCAVRWSGKIKPGIVSNEIVAHHNWLPMILAIAGDTDVGDKLLKGHPIGEMTDKVHLDGYNLVPYLTGDAEKSPRISFIYCNDDQQVVGLRYDNWKIVFEEQRTPGTLRIWAEPFTTLRVPKIFNLRTDPFERADITSKPSETRKRWEIREGGAGEIRRFGDR
jgi:arylsulfatase A-like enzyme